MKGDDYSRQTTDIFPPDRYEETYGFKDPRFNPEKDRPGIQITTNSSIETGRTHIQESHTPVDKVIEIDIKNMDYHLTMVSRRESEILQKWQQKLAKLHELDYKDQ